MLIQQFSDKSVLEAARERIAFVFDHYESIIVSVSGGKDSGVLAHLALTEAHKRDRRIGLFLLDEEALYQSSVDQVEYLMSLFPDNTKRYWLQVPFQLTNAVSLGDGQLNAWEPGKHKIWMRTKGEANIKAPPWKQGSEVGKKRCMEMIDFYSVLENFERCFENTAFLVGLRAAGESPNRWRTMVKNPVAIGGRDVYWATKRHGTNVTMYPIFDWNFTDVWKYHAETGIKYSKIYDFQLKKGYAINEMRVSSLIHERSFKSLCDLPEFEPKTYEKLVKRVGGISFAQETGKNAKVFKARKLPKSFTTWQSYRDFLLATYPNEERKAIFVKRFAKHLNNEYVARQQCRQLILNDYENNLSVDNKPDPRDQLIDYYREVL